jgi:hypothetical protein
VPERAGGVGLAADVDAGSAGGVFLGFAFAEDFADDGRGVALAEDEVAEQVAEGAVFGPFEVAVGAGSGGVA